MSDLPATSAPRRVYKRVVLKLSGEALRADGSLDNISPPIVEDIAHQIKTAYQTGLEIGIVVGDIFDDRRRNIVQTAVRPERFTAQFKNNTLIDATGSTGGRQI